MVKAEQVLFKSSSEKHPNHVAKLPQSHRKSHVKTTHFCRDPQEILSDFFSRSRPFRVLLFSHYFDYIIFDNFDGWVHGKFHENIIH